MNFLLSFPLAIWALVAIPILIGIYLLKNRFRKHTVSSLILWMNQRQTKQGGIIFEKISAPLLFIIELLTIIMLILAATAPLLRAMTQRSDYIVILDNSYSMLCETTSTPKERAMNDIIRTLNESGEFNAIFILASRKPTILASDVRSIERVKDLLKGWDCRCESSQLEAAVSFANELSNKARVLLVTDHQTQMVIPNGAFECRAYGESAGNVAFVNATLSNNSNSYRCLLSIANLCDEAIETNLHISTLETGKTILDKEIALKPKETYRLIFEPLAANLPLIAKLPNDSLAIDNEVVLFPEPKKKARIAVQLKDEVLRESVNKAISGNSNVSFSKTSPHLLITDSQEFYDVGNNCWILRIHSDEDAQAYLGPFVMDNSHPLTEGLGLDGLIWAGQTDFTNSMRPLITAGNVPLLLVGDRVSGVNEIVLNLNAKISTVTRSPNWPIFLYNLVNWRIAGMPGLEKTNYIAGVPVRYSPQNISGSIKLISSQNKIHSIPTAQEQVVIELNETGIHTIVEDDVEHEFVVNMTSYRESDITKATSQKWGQWDEAKLFWWEYRPLDWLFLLIALGLLVLHRFITSRQLEGARRI